MGPWQKCLRKGLVLAVPPQRRQLAVVSGQHGSVGRCSLCKPDMCHCHLFTPFINQGAVVFYFEEINGQRNC